MQYTSHEPPHDAPILAHDGAGGYTSSSYGDLKSKLVASPDSVICLYFSASWCQPCQQFTPKLIEAYEDSRSKGLNFEVIFISQDKTRLEYNTYFSKMPWYALPFKHTTIRRLLSRHAVMSFPTVVLLRADGTVINHNAVREIMRGVPFPFVDAEREVQPQGPRALQISQPPARLPIDDRPAPTLNPFTLTGAVDIRGIGAPIAATVALGPVTVLLTTDGSAMPLHCCGRKSYTVLPTAAAALLSSHTATAPSVFAPCVPLPGLASGLSWKFVPLPALQRLLVLALNADTQARKTVHTQSHTSYLPLPFAAYSPQACALHVFALVARVRVQDQCASIADAVMLALARTEDLHQPLHSVAALPTGHLALVGVSGATRVVSFAMLPSAAFAQAMGALTGEDLAQEAPTSPSPTVSRTYMQVLFGCLANARRAVSAQFACAASGEPSAGAVGELLGQLGNTLSQTLCTLSLRTEQVLPALEEGRVGTAVASSEGECSWAAEHACSEPGAGAVWDVIMRSAATEESSARVKRPRWACVGDACTRVEEEEEEDDAIGGGEEWEMVCEGDVCKRVRRSTRMSQAYLEAHLPLTTDTIAHARDVSLGLAPAAPGDEASSTRMGDDALPTSLCRARPGVLQRGGMREWRLCGAYVVLCVWREQSAATYRVNVRWEGAAARADVDLIALTPRVVAVPLLAVQPHPMGFIAADTTGALIVVDHRLLVRSAAPAITDASLGPVALHSLTIEPSPDGALRASTGMHVCVTGLPASTLQIQHLSLDAEVEVPTLFKDKKAVDTAITNITQGGPLNPWLRPTHKVVHPLSIIAISTRSGWRMRGDKWVLDVEVMTVCRDGLIRVLSTDMTRAMDDAEKQVFAKLRAEVSKQAL